jgi:hypothetical protein
MLRWNRVRSSALAVALLAGLVACGSDTPTGGGGPSHTPPPTPPPLVVLVQRTSLPLAVMDLGSIDFTTTSAGSVEAIVDWTYTTNDIDVYITRQCTFDEFVAEKCTMLAFSESSTAKPERPRAASVPAGTHTLWVGNLGPSQESVSLEIVFTANATAGAGPAADAVRQGPTFTKGKPTASVPLR